MSEETEVREVKESKVGNYFKTLPKRYFITAFSGMAQGLFVTLIAGTILAQIAGWIGDNYIGMMSRRLPINPDSPEVMRAKRASKSMSPSMA